MVWKSNLYCGYGVLKYKCKSKQNDHNSLGLLKDIILNIYI